MKLAQLKSFWCDQTSEPIKISVSRMRVVMMILNWMKIINNLLI